MDTISDNITYESLINDLKIQDDQILSLFITGSKLHGTFLPESDLDFLMVVKDTCDLPEGKRIERDKIDVTIFTESEFKAKIEAGDDFQTIESLWISKDYVWKDKIAWIEFYKHDITKLRVAVSAIASKGHAYSKILMLKEQNFRLAKKNLAHEIRNLSFGIDIIKNGKITDYTATKDIHALIMQEDSEEWNYYNQKWGSVAMDLQKQFIALTPAKIKPPKPSKQKKKKNTNFEKFDRDLESISTS